MLFLCREDGQGLVEYAFLLSLVAFILIALLTVLGTQVVAIYSWITDQLAAI